MIAVSNKLFSEEVLLTEPVNIEIICVQVKLRSKSFFIICSYIPPKSPIETYEKHKEVVDILLSKLKSSDSLILLGDFNIPTISWHKEPDSNCLNPLNSNNVFLNGLSDGGLFQINNTTNMFGKLLDLIFVTEPAEYFTTRISPLSNPEDRYHPTLEITYSSPCSTLNSRQHEKIFCFKRTNYDALSTALCQINWNDVFALHNDNLDQMLNSFYSLLNECLLKSVPKSLVLISNGPPWNSQFLTNLKNKKNKAYKKYKKHATSFNYMKYSIARSEYNMANRYAYNNYLYKIKNNLKSDPKSFYRFVNSKRRSNEFPNTMKYNGSEKSDDTSISNMFAEFFASTYSFSSFNNTSQYPYNVPASSFISIPFIHDHIVLNNLKSLKWSYAAGYDGIPSCVLKKCANLLYIPLAFLFNMSLKLGYFPDVWKTSIISPLFKSGSKSNIANYRGIAKLSCIPKLFEKIITDVLSYQSSSIFRSEQHGFRKSRSIVTNLLELTTFVNDGFVNKKQTDVVYTDFSKAFDKVNHNLLLFKLDQMGFSKPLINWIESYLKGRKQYVKFRTAQSHVINVTSGVPQGSHLGPLLFTLFINDLPSALQYCKSLMYADDVKLLLAFKNPDDQSLLQIDINNFTTWCNINLMDLNTNKCKYMVFTRSFPINGLYEMNNLRLEMVETFNDLGILLDKHLDFRDHISKTINKAKGVLGFIKRWAKEFSDPYTTKQLYTTLVRPILEFGSVIWDPFYNVHSNSIESVQKQFLIFCLRGLGWDPTLQLPPYRDRLSLIKLPTLQSRRQMLNVTFLLNLINGNLHSEFLLSKISFNVPHRSSRYYEFLIVKYFTTNYANSDPFRRICIEFNKLYHVIDIHKSVNAVKNDVIFYLNN